MPVEMLLPESGAFPLRLLVAPQTWQHVERKWDTEMDDPYLKCSFDLCFDSGSSYCSNAASIVTEDVATTWVKSPVGQSSLASVLAFGLDPCPDSMEAQGYKLCSISCFGEFGE